MTRPTDAQVHRAAVTIGAIGARLHTNPAALVELVDTMAALVGTTGTRGGIRGKGSISDPTAAAALTDDEVRHTLDRLYRDIDQAATVLGRIAADWTRYMPSAAEARKRADTLADLSIDAECCTVHARAGLHRTRDRYVDRCRFCGDFRASEGADPPSALLRELDRQGRDRITPTLRAQFLAGVKS